MDSNPFILSEKANIAIVAGNASREIISNLQALGMTVIPTIKCRETYDSIAYHPDIVMHPLDHETLIVAPNLYDYYKEALAPFQIELIKGESWIGDKYPNNIAYNVARISNYALHNLKYTDPILKSNLEKRGIKFINVKQGYSKCSIALVDDGSAISSDPVICRELESLGLFCLHIEAGHIRLPGQKYGFIGGATGLYSNREILLTGHLDLHPSRGRIFKFIEERKKEILYLSQEEIEDLGTIICLSAKEAEN